MTPVVVTSSLAGLACPREPDGSWGVAGAAAGGVLAGNVTGPGVATGTTATEAAAAGAVETLGAGATAAGAEETGATAAGAIAGVLPPELPQSGLPLPAWPRPKVHGAGATIGAVAVVAVEWVSGGGWASGALNSFIFSFKAVRAAAWAEASAAGIFWAKSASAGAVEVDAALAGATAAGILVA